METASQYTFLVTGASGYIGAWIVKYLLDDGHRVHAAVRDKRDTKKIEHLTALAESSPGILALFEADLLRPGSFDEAMRGCDFVIHTASPFIVQGVKNADLQLISPAVEGTENVLRSVNDTPSVKRVVQTSSCAAVMTDPVEAENLPGGKFDESIWNTTADEKHHPYAYSKTLAEREAWKIAEQQDRWSLVTLNPGFVIGPSLSRRVDSTSIRFMIDMLNGKFKMGILNMYMGFVDVRDTARAHILAALREEASGRHLITADTLSYLELAALLRERVGDEYSLPRRNIPRLLALMLGPLWGISRKMIRLGWGIPFKYDNSYAKKDLGITFRPLGESAADHAEQLRRDNLLQKPPL